MKIKCHFFCYPMCEQKPGTFVAYKAGKMIKGTRLGADSFCFMLFLGGELLLIIQNLWIALPFGLKFNNDLFIGLTPFGRIKDKPGFFVAHGKQYRNPVSVRNIKRFFNAFMVKSVHGMGIKA